MAKKEIIKLDIDVVILHSRIGFTEYSAVKKLVNFIKSRGNKVVIIGPTPDYEKSVPLMVYNKFKFNEGFSTKNRFYFEDSYHKEITFFENIADGRTVTYLDAVKVFCNPDCIIRDRNKGKLFYFDFGHLTISGSNFLITKLDSSLK